MPLTVSDRAVDTATITIPSYRVERVRVEVLTMLADACNEVKGWGEKLSNVLSFSGPPTEEGDREQLEGNVHTDGARVAEWLDLWNQIGPVVGDEDAAEITARRSTLMSIAHGCAMTASDDIGTACDTLGASAGSVPARQVVAEVTDWLDLHDTIQRGECSVGDAS